MQTGEDIREVTKWLVTE